MQAQIALRGRILSCSPMRSFSLQASSMNKLAAPLRANRRQIALAAPQNFSQSRSIPFDWRRVAIAGGAVIAGTVGLNAVLNRETRQNGFSIIERQHLNSTFKSMGAGLGVLAITAIGLHRSGLSLRIAIRAQANPWLTLGASLVGCVGTMMLVHATEPGSAAKYASFVAFNGAQAVLLSPMLFFAPALLGRAALYTAGLVGSLSYVGATAKEDRYLFIGGPLMAGLVIVALSSLAPMILPAASAALPIAQSISLYGGLAVFGGFTLYDVQKVLHHARQAEVTGQVARLDPVADAIGLELDFINIFIRMVMILQGGGNRRK